MGKTSILHLLQFLANNQWTTKGKVFILSGIKIQMFVGPPSKFLSIYPKCHAVLKYGRLKFPHCGKLNTQLKRYFEWSDLTIRIIRLISIHFVKFQIFTLISIRFINFPINTSTSIHITRKWKILHLRILFCQSMSSNL